MFVSCQSKSMAKFKVNVGEHNQRARKNLGQFCNVPQAVWQALPSSLSRRVCWYSLPRATPRSRLRADTGQGPVALISPASDLSTRQPYRRGLLNVWTDIEYTSLLAARWAVRRFQLHPDSSKPSVAWGGRGGPSSGVLVPDQGHPGLVPTNDCFHLSLLKNGPCLRIHKTYRMHH